FLGCSFVMKFGVRGIFELTGHERVGIALDELVGPLNGSLHALGVGSADHFRAEGAHDHDFFFREAFRNKQHNFIATVHTDQRETDSCVAGWSFDDWAAWLQQAVLLGPMDNSYGCAVLHTAAGIDVLEFGENICRVGWNKPLQLKHGSSADQFCDVVGNAQAGVREGFRPHTTGYGSGTEASIELSAGQHSAISGGPSTAHRRTPAPGRRSSRCGCAL